MPPSDNAATPQINVPFFWPMQLAADMAAQGLELAARNVKFLDEELRLHGGIKPRLATAHSVRLTLRTPGLCDDSADDARGTPTLVIAPHTGLTSMIADDQKAQKAKA
jgi:hypothetical protein